MKIEELFYEIVPPEGGWNKLQERLSTQPRPFRQKFNLRPLFVGFTAVMLGCLLILNFSRDARSPLSLARKQNDLIVYQLGLEIFPEDKKLN